jgi:sugar lactone lactonase YvrE
MKPLLRRTIWILGLLALLVPAGALADRGSGGGHRGGSQSLPQTIALPNGWRPEGIAGGHGSSLFVGSIPTGAVWKASARTGQGAVLVPPRDGRAAIGLKVDKRNRLVVAGGPTGKAFLYDARTGANVADFQLAPAGVETFVNDVAVTRRGAFFTDSVNQQLYVLPYGRRGGLPDQDDVRTVPLTGEISYSEPGPNANGIVAVKGGRHLIVVQGNEGRLFVVNPRMGNTREIDLGGADVTNGDGLLLFGRTLFVVQNLRNQIAVVRLSRNLGRGRIVRTITDLDFDVPTTLAFQKGALWTVNARFTTPPGPDVTYQIVRVG